jgi:phosphatidate cytidylyltransferase
VLLPRVLTALVAAPLLLWVLWLGSLPFLVFLFFLILIGLWEFHAMAEEGGHATQSWWGIALGLFVTVAFFLSGVKPDLPFAGQAPALAVTTAVILAVFREMARREKSVSMVRLGMTASGILFIAWPFSFLGLLRELRGAGDLYHAGRDATFFLVVLIWVQDTAAYVVGRALGRHRLAAVISPKKSWEGAIGGLLIAVLAALLCRETFAQELFGRGEAAAVAAVLGILAQLSDLAESLFKRCFGVKDSSQLLPGHGGILDRFDSFLLSAPILYFYLTATGRGV